MSETNMLGKSTCIGPTSLKILAYLLDQRGKGMASSIRDLAKITGLCSCHSVHMQIRRLRSMGLLTFDDRKKRTIMPACEIILFDSTAQPQ